MLHALGQGDEGGAVLDRHGAHQLVEKDEINAGLKNTRQPCEDDDQLHLLGRSDQSRVQGQTGRRPKQDEARPPAARALGPEEIAHQQHRRLRGVDRPDPGIARLHFAHEIQGEQGDRKKGARKEYEALDGKAHELALVQNQPGVVLPALAPSQAGHGGRRLGVRQDDMAGEVIADQAAQRQAEEYDLVIQRGADPVQHLADQGNGDRRGQPQDGPTAAHQFIAVHRPGDGVHHHRERDRQQGLGQCGQSPNQQHRLHQVFLGHNERRQAGGGVGRHDQQPGGAEPGHDLPARLQEAPDDNGQEQPGERRHRGEHPHLKIRRPHAGEKYR